jgi:hypothetical protein
MKVQLRRTSSILITSILFNLLNRFADSRITITGCKFLTRTVEAADLNEINKRILVLFFSYF